MVNKNYHDKKQREKEAGRKFNGNGPKEYVYAPRTTAAINCSVCDGYDQSCSNYKAQSHVYVTTCKTKYSFGSQVGELERRLNAETIN